MNSKLPLPFEAEARRLHLPLPSHEEGSGDTGRLLQASVHRTCLHGMLPWTYASNQCFMLRFMNMFSHAVDHEFL